MRQQTLRDKLLGYAAPQEPVQDPTPAMDFEMGWSQILLQGQIFKVRVVIADFKDMTIFPLEDIKRWRKNGCRAFHYTVKCKDKWFYGEMITQTHIMLGWRGLLNAVQELCDTAARGAASTLPLSPDAYSLKTYAMAERDAQVAALKFWAMIQVDYKQASDECSQLRYALPEIDQP